MVNEPAVMVNTANSVVPSPNAARALASVIWVVKFGEVPCRVKVKSPVIRCPATTSATPVPSTRR